jgi:RNA ligase (TIGR02306 family)
MERKLASIQRIDNINPIPNADAIEVAQVLGWKCVIKKGEFKVQDLSIFVEIDSILPDRPEFEFMKSRHFRVKTIRLRGQISQGIVFPLSILPQDKFEQMSQAPVDKILGLDVTEMLNIQKWEPYIPAQLAGKVKGNFPSFLHKTDEVRIQAVPKVLDRYQGDVFFYVTEKVDGSSFTAYYRSGEYGICSRNLELKEEEGNSFWKLAKALDLETKLRIINRNIAIQGEMVGMGIQKNKYNFSDVRLFVFSVFDINNGKYLDFCEAEAVCKELQLDMVPIVERSYFLPKTVDELVEFSKGVSLLNKNIPREGIVFRPHEELYDKDIEGRLSFKVINPLFLLRYDE